MTRASGRFKAVLFDKDGTLFDFRATWDAWAGQIIRQLCSDDAEAMAELAQAFDYDLKTGAFRPSSFVIAGSNSEVAEVAARVLGRADIAGIERELMTSAARAPLAPAVPLAPLLSEMRAFGYKLGVMTNDAESTAHAHLSGAGVREQFDFICGCDSGHGAKPAPEPLLAFCTHVGVDPFHTAMVGDSAHDLHAASAAGMAGVGVLTGVARAAELAPLADAVLADIGELPAWLAQN